MPGWGGEGLELGNLELGDSRRVGPRVDWSSSAIARAPAASASAAIAV
jgi:hypothetical protein